MANPTRQAVDKFGTLDFVDDNASFAERALREVQLVGQAMGSGMIDHADTVTKEFLESSPNKLATFFVGSYGITQLTTSLLKRYQVAGKIILNVGGLAYSAMTVADMSRDSQRWQTMKQAMDDTWLNGKNLAHSVKMSEKEFARTTFDVGAIGIGVVPLAAEGIGRLSFLKRCKVDPSGCTNKADDFFAKGEFAKAGSTLEGVLKFTERREPNNFLAIGELNSKLARCKFKEAEQFKDLSRVEQILHPTEKLELAAIDHHKKAITALKSAPSEKMDVTDTLIDMGNWYKSEKRFAQSHEAYASALGIRGKHFPKEDQMPMATLWEHMGDLHDVQKKHDLADTCYAKAIKIIENKHGPLDGRLIVPLDRRGGYAYQNGQFQEAEDYMTRALQLKRDRYPAGDPRIGEHIPCLADVLRSQGGEKKLRGAQSLYWEGAIQGQSYGFGDTERTRIAGGITGCAESLEKIVQQKIAQASSAQEIEALNTELKLLGSESKGIPWLVFGEQPQKMELVRSLTPKQSFNL